MNPRLRQTGNGGQEGVGLAGGGVGEGPGEESIARRDGVKVHAARAQEEIVEFRAESVEVSKPQPEAEAAPHLLLNVKVRTTKEHLRTIRSQHPPRGQGSRGDQGR